MKRIVTLIFLLLYVYNFAGYLAVFSIMQHRVKSEVKLMLKASVPESELRVLSFHTASLEQGLYPIFWLEYNEFRFEGGMYDIVRSHGSADTTYFHCINDVQEEILFTDLNDHVQRHLGNSEEQTTLDQFKDVFKASNIQPGQYFYRPPLMRVSADLTTGHCASITRDVPFPPPRHHSAA